MASTVIKFHPGGPAGLRASDPQVSPTLIIGQLPHLQAVGYQVLRPKLDPRVSEETFKFAIENLNPSPTDSVPLYLNNATVLALPKGCSRHNTPSRAHTLTKLIKGSHVGGNGSTNNENIVIVCEKSCVFASAVAVAKAFPLYSRKTSSNSKNSEGCKKEPRVLNVEFLVVNRADGSDLKISDSGLTVEEIGLLENTSTAVRYRNVLK